MLVLRERSGHLGAECTLQLVKLPLQCLDRLIRLALLVKGHAQLADLTLLALKQCQHILKRGLHILNQLPVITDQLK